MRDTASVTMPSPLGYAQRPAHGQPQQQRPNRLLIGALVGGVLALFAVTAATIVGAVWWTHRDMTVHGTVTLTRSYGTQGNTCHGANGYDDVAPGGQVVISDSRGTVLAVGSLAEGHTVGELAGACEIPWTVTGVPRGRGPYGITITHRGVVRATQEELGRTVQLTIG